MSRRDLSGDRVASVAAQFRRRAGTDPDGVWCAPGRVNLIGEHTDYNDGFVLPVAISQGTFAAVARRGGGRLRIWSLQDPEGADVEVGDIGPGRRGRWTVYVEGVAWAFLEAGVEVRGADVLVDTTLPLGSGLSSSAALQCSVALALSDLYGARLAPAALALLAQRAENEVVGVPSGVMDQMASMLGRRDHALFLDARSLESEHIPLGLEAASLRLIVIDTNVPRRLAVGAYAERRAACEAAAGLLGADALRDVTPEQLAAAAGRLGDVAYRRARHVVSEDERVLAAVRLLRAGDPRALGHLLDESHRSLRDDFEVSTVELDAAVDAARTAGALGARMTGAGFGGCALALVPDERVRDVERRVAEAFAARRFHEPGIFAVSAADGARRLA